MNIPGIKINSAGLADYPGGTSLGPRELHDFEIVWIERGDCQWISSGKTLPCPPGTVILCQPGIRDRFVWDRRRTTRHGYIHFEFLDGLDEFLPVFRSCKGDDVLRPMLRHAVWLAGQDTPGTDQLATRALRQALGWYRSGFFMHGGRPSTQEQHPVLSRALGVLKDRWRDEPKRPPSVAEWAASSGVSRGHLARVCKQHFGVSPGELLRLLRLEHGLQLLVRSNLKVQSISALCGFATPFHFSRCCKEAYGLSPREIRAQSNAGDGRPQSPVSGIRHIWQQLNELQ